MGEAENRHLRLDFDSNLKLEFRGAKVTTDAGLLAVRELDGALGLTDMAGAMIKDGRTGRDIRHQMTGLLCSSSPTTLGNFLRRFALPGEISQWSLRSVQLKLIKIGASIIDHARRTVFQMAEVAVPGELFAEVLARIRSLAPAPT